VGYGAGVRVRSPIGPFRLDFAYGEKTEEFRIHFSVGVAF
jgi:translocation and assembly module TamA